MKQEAPPLSVSVGGGSSPNAGKLDIQIWEFPDPGISGKEIYVVLWDEE